MAVAQGYEKIPTNGLVFMYDVADSTSYKGEPTTNLINPDAPNIYSWWGRNVQTITQLSETYKGQPIYRVSLSIDSGDMLYHITARWGAGSGWYLSSTTYYANTPYMASVIYRPVSHADTRVYGHPSNIAGWGANIDDSIDLDNGWKQHKIDRNYGTTVGDNRFHHMHTPSAQIGQTVTVDITNSQIEAKSYSTPFVNGTRSATQALFPLVNNNTFDLSNVSFNSNGQIYFDGTNDRIDISYGSVVSNELSRSWEVIVKPTATMTYAGIFGNKIGYGCSYHCNGGIYLWDGNWVFDWYDNSSYQFLYSYVSPVVNAYTHIVGTYDASDQKPRIYVNGQLKATYGSATNMNYGGATYIIDIGWNSGGYHYFQGELPVTKYYSGKALSASEVQQSYNKYKTRFNLS